MIRPQLSSRCSKSSEESNGTTAMTDALIKDFDKEMTDAEFTEKDAQGNYRYEAMMKYSIERASNCHHMQQGSRC